MSNSALCDLLNDELYLAGQLVAAGLYKEIETGREVRLDRADSLPATHNGRVGAYVCVRNKWDRWQLEMKEVSAI